MHSNEIPNENTVVDTNRKKEEKKQNHCRQQHKYYPHSVNLLKYYCFNAKRTRQI